MLLKYLQQVVLVYPAVLGENYSDYICSYNEPYYIRLEKMEIMYRMTNERNAKAIMNEFYEYHKELNADFVKISIEYIAKICLRVNIETPHGIDLYIKILENLAEKTGADYLDSICIASVKIMRVFPKVKGGTQIVKLIAGRFKDLFSTEAKASFIWLLGEYCKRIENPGPILEHFTKSYFSQPAEVQLRILSTGIKMYLFQIEPIDSVMGDLIQSISDKSTNPDLRDRGYIYWRLLYKDDEKAKEVIFNEPQAVEVDTKFSKEQIEEARRMLKLGGRISGILQKSPEELFKGKESVNRGNVELDAEVILTADQKPKETQPAPKQEAVANDNILDDPIIPTHPAPLPTKPLAQPPKDPSPISTPNVKEKKKIGPPSGPTITKQPSASTKEKEINLLDMDFDEPAQSPAKQQPVASPQPAAALKKHDFDEENLFEEEDQEEDLFEGAGDMAECRFVSMPEEVAAADQTFVRKETKGKSGNSGVSVKGNFYKEGQLTPLLLRLSIKNHTGVPVDQITIQFKANYFGLKAIKPATGAIGTIS